MELTLKKYFWIVPLLVIVVCALVAAKGVNELIEAEFLLGDAKPAAARPRMPKKHEAPKPAPSKDADLVIARNIFCSSCEPAKPELPVTQAPVADDGRPPATSLPLALLATSIARDGAHSVATITNTQNFHAGLYGIEDEIPEAGQVVEIHPRYVDFKNRTNNRVERIDLLGAAAVVASAPRAGGIEPPQPPPPGDNVEGQFMAEVDKGVHKTDDTHYQIDRSLVDKVLGDPTMVMKSARIVPSIKDNQANGFKMYAIRPNSVFAKIGLQNGDTIQSINGYEMTSPDKALEVYTKVKSASSLSIQVLRRGAPVTMEYSIK